MIDRTELSTVLKSIGHRDLTETDLDKLISEIDLNKNGKIEFSEFIKVYMNKNR